MGVWKTPPVKKLGDQISLDDGVATSVPPHQGLVRLDDLEDGVDEEVPEPEPLVVERGQQDSLEVELIDQKRLTDSVNNLRPNEVFDQWLIQVHLSKIGAQGGTWDAL